MSQKKILRLREAGKVERCHTIPHHGSYSVSSHVYGMLVLIEVLYPKTPSINLLRAILLHDVPERWLGDIPGSVRAIDPKLKDSFAEIENTIRKRYGLKMPGLTADEKKWLKAVDRIEFLMWCLDEVNSGNESVSNVVQDMIEELEARDLPKECREFVDKFEWERMSDY